MEPIKFEVSISVNVDLSQGTRDFVSQIVDRKIAASNESAERFLALLTQMLGMLQPPIPIPVCGEMTPKGPIGPNGKPMATEAQIEADAMNEAAKAAEEAKKAEEKKPEPQAQPASTISIESVRAVLATKVNDHREAIKNKLNELGAPSVTKLDPSKYQEMYDFLNSL